MKELLKSRNAKLFLILTFLQNCWFTEATWFFYVARFSDYTKLGVLFSIMIIVWVIAEIPTGIFADRFGRKPSVTWGFVCVALGGAFFAASQNFWWIAVGLFADSIGRAFISGALEALLYDSLKSTHEEHKFNRLVSLRTQVALCAYLISVTIGGFAYAYYYRLPSTLFALVSACAVVVSLWLQETKMISQPSSNVLNDIFSGMKQLWQIGLQPFLVPIVTMTVVTFLFDWGFSRPAMALSFGLDSRGQGLLYAGLALAGLMVVSLLPVLQRRVTDFSGLNILNLLMGLAFMMSALPLGLYGIITILIIELSWNVAEPWISTIINHHIESRLRATTLSAVQFIAKLPYIIINLVLGEAIDSGKVATFHFSLGLIMVSLILINLLVVVYFKRQKLALAQIQINK